MSATVPVGLVLGSALAPADIGPAARAGEQAGFSELWLPEDYFFTGGISGAATALAATEHVPVGLGIMSSMVRHPAVLAMELATLGQVYPGRLWPGIGLGLPAWLGQMGVMPKSGLTAVRECVQSVRALLAGETVTGQLAYARLEEITLTYNLKDAVPPIYVGAVGPKMLQMAGDVGDGSVLSVLASPGYVRWAKERIAEAGGGGRNGRHRTVTFALFSVDEDGDRAREQIKPIVGFYLQAMAGSPLIVSSPYAEQLSPMLEQPLDDLVDQLPEEWLTEFAVVGTPAECARSIERLHEAGSDSVLLFPFPSDRASELITLAGERVLPLL